METMTRFHRGVLSLLFPLLFTFSPNLHFVHSPANGDAPICLPLSDLAAEDECLPLGPADYLDRTEEQGISFPILHLPVQKPDPVHSELPYAYRRVARENARLFLSLDAAIVGGPIYRYLETGFDYVTFIERTVVDGKTYYMIDPGVWMQGEGLSPIALPSFQGLEFTSTPRNDFGWVLFPLEAQSIPGNEDAVIERYDYFPYDVVQVFASEVVDGNEWYLVAPGQWVDGSQVAVVRPNPIPPAGVDNERWIEVNLEQQTLAVYENRRLVFATVISSGFPGTWTQPGLFQVYEKLESEQMSGSFVADRSDYYYLEDVPWTMYFDRSRAQHGTYWHNSFGQPRSKGCENLSPGDAHWLFSWANEGDWIYVWDPSGETPTDPSLYGDGGA